MNKKQKSLLAVYAIVFVVFNILYFIIPFPKTPCVWTAYAFALVAVILGCGITFYAFKDTETLRSKVYGFPVFRIGYIYLFAQLIVSIVIFIINIFVVVPLWIGAALSVVILGLALIGVIATDNARDIIEDFEKKAEKATEKITYFKLDVSGIISVCRDADVKKKLNVLSDKLKYSDPVSSPKLAEAENKIAYEISQLSKIVNSESKDDVVSKIDDIIAMLENRNNMCKALK